MSLIAYEAVWELKLQPSEKLIMLCLAEHHNKDTDQCNPAYKTIAEETGLSKQHVIRLVAKLEISGVIAIKNKAGCGSGNSNNYEISVLKGNITLPLVTPEPPQKVTQKVTSEQIKGNTVLPEPIREPIEPNTTPSGVAAKPQPARSKPSTIPAVKIHVEVVGKWLLNKAQIGEADRVVGRDPPALEKWRETVKAWVLRGFDPRNLPGQLDWFRNGIPVYQNGASNGTHNNQKSGRTPAGRASPGHRADASQQSDDSGGIPAQVAAAFRRLSRASSSGT